MIIWHASPMFVECCNFVLKKRQLTTAHCFALIWCCCWRLLSLPLAKHVCALREPTSRRRSPSNCCTFVSECKRLALSDWLALPVVVGYDGCVYFDADWMVVFSAWICVFRGQNAHNKELNARAWFTVFVSPNTHVFWKNYSRVFTHPGGGEIRYLKFTVTEKMGQ